MKRYGKNDRFRLDIPEDIQQNLNETLEDTPLKPTSTMPIS